MRWLATEVVEEAVDTVEGEAVGEDAVGSQAPTPRQWAEAVAGRHLTDQYLRKTNSWQRSH